jgi:hypothetical protein
VVGGGREGLGGVRRCQDASFRNCALIWRASGHSRYRLAHAPRAGGPERAGDARGLAGARRLLSGHGHQPARARSEEISTLRPIRARAKLEEGSAKSQSSCKRSGCRDGSPSTPSRPKSDLTGAPSQGPTRR